MAPSWSARLFSIGSSERNNASNDSKRDAPFRSQDPLDSSISTASQVTPRPRTAGASPMHSHTRSRSQPIPKLVSRKKSAGNLGRSYQDGEVNLDEALVPVLDDSPVGAMPRRTWSDKRQKQNGTSADGQVSRRCMCCDSRVKVSKELDKFRCMCCLTVNDLVSIVQQKQANIGKDTKEISKGRDEVTTGVRTVISIERTRAIIERCLLTYLESRSRRFDSLTIPSPDGSECRKFSSASFESSQGKSVSLSHNKPGFDACVANASPKNQSPVSPQDKTSATQQSLFKPVSYSRPFSALSKSEATRGQHHNEADPPEEPSRKPPPPPAQLSFRPPTRQERPMLGSSRRRGSSSQRPTSPKSDAADANARRQYEHCKTIFRPLEDYMSSTIGDLAVFNASFSTIRPALLGRAKSESHITTPPPEPADGQMLDLVGGLDAKTLLLGDIGENGSWWTGKIGRRDDAKSRKRPGSDVKKAVTSRSPNINWSQVAAWYSIIHTAGLDWQRHLDVFKATNLKPQNLDGPANLAEIEEELKQAREHSIRALLKIVENVLKRPGKHIKDPEDLRFLLVILANPSLSPSTACWLRGLTTTSTVALTQAQNSTSVSATTIKEPVSPSKLLAVRESGQHSGILKRAFGLLGNAPDACHRYVVGWLSRLDEEHFISLVDLCSGFINYRLSKQGKQPRASNAYIDGGLIPDFSGGARHTSAQLHSAVGLSSTNKKAASESNNEPPWADDWQLRGAAKLMSLLFAANNIWQGKRKEDNIPRVDSGISNRANQSQDKARCSGQLLHMSSFYNSLLDFQDIVADFKLWESRKNEKFAFCRYPLFLSMGAKTKILEYDARRQMEIKAREAYFDNIIRQQAIEGHLHLKVRRDCMVDDSLRQISEAVGSGPEELKKGLRVHFAGEEGVDAGGLRKEWFLMLVREVFDADHGLFVYDEESRACYFNPYTFETSDQYYLIGAVLGLAIYNSTILDIALPPFAFRKLLAAAPTSHHASLLSNVSTLSAIRYTLADLAEYRPALATGLQQLLDFEGDVESTYCWSFVAPVDRYGTVSEVPLVEGGDKKAVTNDNRTEFVDAYVRYLLDTAVARQFEPFKRGFFTVCAGNALSLFRAEEIELLVRGSDEILNVNSLKAVAIYENWRQACEPHKTILAPAEEEEVIQWFWQAFSSARPDRKRKLLAFITGSDRIPAVGATSLVLRIVAGGDGWSGFDTRGHNELQRYPIARTCFNMLVLWRYTSKEQLEHKLWGAVENSEGFGLK